MQFILISHFSFKPPHLLSLSLSKMHLSIYLPAENETTAHLPFQPHFLAPLSPPPPSIAFNSSSKPGLRPTTTSALQVRRARTLRPELVPRGPIAVVKGVVGSHVACLFSVSFCLCYKLREKRGL